MIDEQVLERELRRVAGFFALPADGASTILAQRDQGKAARAGRARRRRWFPIVMVPVIGLATVVAAVAVFWPGSHATKRSVTETAALRQAGAVGPSTAHAPIATFGPNQPATVSGTVASDFASKGSTLSGSAAGGSATGSAAAPTDSLSGPLDTKVVKTGEIGLVVSKDRFSSAFGQLTTIATGVGGYVSSSTTSEDASSPSGHVTLRVPVASFEDVVGRVRKLGQVTTVSSSGRDVTAESVDLDARISSLSTARQQYLTLMTKATTVGDVLAVQQQINELQTQIEQLQGQKRVLDSQAAMSTLDVNLGDRRTATPPKAPSGLSRAWHRATRGFVGALEGLVGASGLILFLLLMGAAIWLLGRPLWRRMRLWAL